MLWKLLKLFTWFCYKYLVPLAFAIYTLFSWEQIDTYESRVMLSCSLILFVRTENCYTIYRFYLKKSSFEYEVTIVLTLVKIVNSIQFPEGDNYGNMVQPVCSLFFDFFLYSNLVCYVGSFFIIIVFALVVLVGFIRGDPEFINPRRGLSVQEMVALRQLKWSEYQLEQKASIKIKVGDQKISEIPLQKNQELVDNSQIISHEFPEENTIQQKQQASRKSINAQQVDQYSIHSKMSFLKRIFDSPKRQNEDKQQLQEQQPQTKVEQEEDVCSICLMTYEADDDIIQLPKCKHLFHSVCIQEWLKSQPNCPFCRDNIRLALMG